MIVPIFKHNWVMENIKYKVILQIGVGQGDRLLRNFFFTFFYIGSEGLTMDYLL